VPSGGPGAIVSGEVLEFLARLAVEIREHLGRGPDVADYLLAFASLPDSLHAQVLAELGVDISSLREAIERSRHVTCSPLGGLAPDVAVERARASLGLAAPE